MDIHGFPWASTDIHAQPRFGGNPWRAEGSQGKPRQGVETPRRGLQEGKSTTNDTRRLPTPKGSSDFIFYVRQMSFGIHRWLEHDWEAIAPGLRRVSSKTITGNTWKVCFSRFWDFLESHFHIECPPNGPWGGPTAPLTILGGHRLPQQNVFIQLHKNESINTNT